GGATVLRRRTQPADCRPRPERSGSAAPITRGDVARRADPPRGRGAGPVKRWTNLALFVLLGLAFVSGWVAFFYATAPSRASLIVHAASGYAIIALTPWKSVIASRAIPRRRPGWWASLLFAMLVLLSVLAGILHS